EHGFFGDDLGAGVGRLDVFAVGHGVGGAAGDRAGRAMGDAGRGRVHQLADAMRAAGGEHVGGADDVGAVVAVAAAPGAGLGGVVEHAVETGGVRAGERG